MSGPEPVKAQEGTPLVSVVINCYNGELFLKEAIDSVYAQTWPRWEIVFWDNASTDGTSEIAHSYDQRLRYFRAERNTPLGEARNLAFAQAGGEFIAMLDSDDVYLPDTLSRLVAGMGDRQTEYAVCYGGELHIDAAGRQIGEARPEAMRGNLFGPLLHHFTIRPCASMVRRSILIESGHGFDLSLTTSEDYCFFLTLAADHPFQSLSHHVSRYRIHEGALTNRTISKWADEWEYTLVKIRSSHPGIERKYSSGFRDALARVDYYRARNLMHNGQRAAARKLLRRNITVDMRYLALFLISLLPMKFWEVAHSWYHKRSQFI
jgi:glycosyltransferase involved in cell wall biosynthesis